MFSNFEHPRRWFRFSLGTLLIAFTLLAVWLGITTASIRARRVMREWIKSNQGMIVTSAESLNSFDPSPRTVKIPALRRWLGDEAIAYVWMPKNATKSDWSRARPLFPEALWMDEVSFDWVPGSEARRKVTEEDPSHSRFLTILTTEEEQKAFDEAAKRAGVRKLEWIRETLNKAAGRPP